MSDHELPPADTDDPRWRSACTATLAALLGSETPTLADFRRAPDEAHANAVLATLCAPPAQLLQALAPRLPPLLAALSDRAPALDIEPLTDRVRAFLAGETHNAARAWYAAVLLWQLAQMPPPRRKLVVYTALVGAKETLANPLADLPPGATSDLELDFVCITDNPALRSEVWRTLIIPGGHLPPEKLSRRPKALPHDYFPEAEFSLYVDNTVSFKRLPQAADLATAQPYLFKAFRHATRVNPEQEAAAVAMLGYDDVSTICNQMAFYAARRPLAEITPLTTATVLLRQHHRAEVKRFGITWWESVLAFSKRDQLSFDFARQESGCEVEYFAGATHDNEFIRWQGSLSQHRVKASFDARRYAWLHRDDASASADPKAHFLRHHQGSDAAYQKRSPLLEFICLTQGSSLGQQVSPRRAMAEALETLLLPHRREGRRYLLLRVQDNPQPQAFSRDEHEAAARALSMFMSPARGTLIDLSAAELQPDGTVYAAMQGHFDALIVLGASAEQVPLLLARLQRLLAADAGSIVFALNAPATLRQAADAEDWLARRLGANTRSALHASLHDDQREALPNTVLGIEWKRSASAQAAAELAA